MLLDKLKNILPQGNSNHPIIQNLYSACEPDDDKVRFIWDAFCFSKDAHSGQKRRSGKPYFSH